MGDWGRSPQGKNIMAERDRSRITGPALEKWYQFLRWLVPTVEKFPKAQKFTLGDRIQGGARWMCWSGFFYGTVDLPEGVSKPS